MATSLSHVQMANQKEQASGLAELDKITIPKDILPEERIPVAQELHNVLFKLVKKKRGRVYLDNCCDNVANPHRGGKKERMWLLSGADSIWQSDLTELIKDKDRYKMSRLNRDIIFLDGVCRVRSDDEMQLEFMRRNTHNVGKRRVGAGKFDFYEYDPAEEQKERHLKQLLKLEMVVKAKEMPEEKAKQLASFFGISFVDEIGRLKDMDGIRTELMLKADNDPVTFQKHIDSKEVEISYLVKRAILDSKIDLGGANGNAIWANGKGLIAKIPSTRKPYEYLTELAMTNSEEGRNFKQQLETLMQ